MGPSQTCRYRPISLNTSAKVWVSRSQITTATASPTYSYRTIRSQTFYCTTMGMEPSQKWRQWQVSPTPRMEKPLLAWEQIFAILITAESPTYFTLPCLGIASHSTRTWEEANSKKQPELQDWLLQRGA